MTTQFLLEGWPSLEIAELRQEAGQPVIGEIEGAHLLAEQRFEQQRALLKPSPNLRDSVISARDDEAQPNGEDFSGSQFAFPVAVLWKMFVKKLDDPHHLQLREQQRDVLGWFCPNDFYQSPDFRGKVVFLVFLDHSLSLLAQGQFKKSALKMSEP